MKKAIIILLVLAAVAGAGYFIYRTRKAKTDAEAGKSTANPTSTAVKQPVDTAR
jgi:flagellar basal body-associated protein FliL